MGTFKKYVRSRFPSFDPPPPPPPSLFAFVRFQTPPPPQWYVRFYVCLELPLSPSISILKKFREKVSLVELNVSFKKPQWILYKVDTTGA